MSTKIKFYSLLICFLIAGRGLTSAQGTVEMVTSNFVGTPALGPTTAAQGPITFRKDLVDAPTDVNNLFADAVGTQLTRLTFSLANQQYTGLTYSNISTGLVFGGAPTTSMSFNFPAVQEVDPLDTYNLLGSFNLTPGGPTNNMFTADPLSAPSVQSGTGIICDGFYSSPANGANGAISVFTAAQVQFDRAGGPFANNSATRYYYGNVVLNFNRFVTNPVIHIAGLGGNYRYLPAGGNPAVAGDWRSTYFSTELEVTPALTLTRMSGNSFFTVSGNNILNSAATPNGASANTGGLFNDFGAATGSFRINGTVKTITLRVYLRGSNSSQFPWSATAASIPGSNRNPFTGDIWWVSASVGLDQLIPLPSTGLYLNAALNGTNVNLNWKTQTELNSKEFEIERSVDGVNFSQIGSKQAAGNTTTETSYSHLDPNMNVSVYYYRVKLVDLDGRYGYSNIATVRKTDIRGVRVFQNPAVSELKLEFTNMKGAYAISLYNMNGQEVVKQTTNISATTQYVSVNRNTIPPGTYSVRISNADNSEVYTHKVVFQ